MLRRSFSGASPLSVFASDTSVSGPAASSLLDTPSATLDASDALPSMLASASLIRLYTTAALPKRMRAFAQAPSAARALSVGCWLLAVTAASTRSKKVESVLHCSA